MSVQAWAVTDVGRKRKHNEDTYVADERLGLYAVADGMGGHAAGEVASARCVEILQEEVASARDVVEAFADAPTEENAEAVQTLLTTAIQKASAQIAQMAEDDITRRGMGTTIVALLTCGAKGVVAHVGDSRAYVVRAGRTHQLTEDHSLIEEHIKRGLMTRAQAEKSDIRNVITRAVGVQASVEVDTLVTDIVQGDVFLLCSDGLHGYFRDPEEVTDLLANIPVSEAAQSFVDFANTRGGKDNVTALVLSAEETAVSRTEITNVDRTIDILKKIPLFQYMNYKELLAVLAITRKRQFGPGEFIIREGESGDEFFVIVRGEVEVRKDDAFFARLQTGGHFGEMALIDQAPRSASVRTVEPTHALVIARDGLMKLMRKDSMMSVKLLWSFSLVLSERLRQTNETVITLRGELDRMRSNTPIPTLRDRPIVKPPFGGQW